MSNGKQLYTPERLAGMNPADMARVVEFAQADVENPDTLYANMDRDQTVATAQCTIADVSAALVAREK